LTLQLATEGTWFFGKAKLLKRCMRIAVRALKAARAKITRLCCLTLELTGPLRQGSLARAEKMYRVPQTGPRWLAVAGPVERRVRRQRLAAGHRHKTNNCSQFCLRCYGCTHMVYPPNQSESHHLKPCQEMGTPRSFISRPIAAARAYSITITTALNDHPNAFLGIAFNRSECALGVAG